MIVLIKAFRRDLPHTLNIQTVLNKKAAISEIIRRRGKQVINIQKKQQ